MPLKLFLVPEVCFPRCLHRLQPRCEVFSERQISMADLSWGHKRSLFSLLYKKSQLAGYAKN